MPIENVVLDGDEQYNVKVTLQDALNKLKALETLILGLNDRLRLREFGDYEPAASIPPPAPEPAPGKALFFEDADNVDVGPLLTKYADAAGVPPVGLVALIHAESGFNTHAVRRGDWPDVSGGYAQFTIQTAAGYGLGDGTSDPANVEAVLGALQARETGVRLAAVHFAKCLAAADQRFPGIAGDERLILGMRAYNGGAGYGLTDDYARKYSANLASYRSALRLAHQVLAGKGWE